MEARQVVICSDRGQVRPTNEDYASHYIPPDPEIRGKLGSLFIIADGMGGRNAGEVASAEAVATLQQEYYFGRWSPDPAKRLEQATSRANFHVFDMSYAMASASNMGCAMTALLLCRGRYYISHVGDTVCLQLRGGKMLKLTSEHHARAPSTRLGMGIFGPRVGAEQRRSFLTRAVGMEMAIRPDIRDGSCAPGDLFTLMTDGITAYLSLEEVIDALVNSTDLNATVLGLVAECNRRGGGDNITLMVIVL